jgi:hypothetical protein
MHRVQWASIAMIVIPGCVNGAGLEDDSAAEAATAAESVVPAATTLTLLGSDVEPVSLDSLGYQNFHSGRCAHVVGSSQAAGAPVEQNGDVENCNTKDHAFVWTAQPFIDAASHQQIGSFLKNFHSGKCLQMLNGRADQANCSSGDHTQAWTFNFIVDQNGRLYHSLQNFHTGKCLHVVGSSSAAGARLDEGTCASFISDHALVWLPFERAL